MYPKKAAGKINLKQALSILITIIMISVGMTSCGNNLESKLTAHQWVKDGSTVLTLTIYDNGTYTLGKAYSSGLQWGESTGTWEIKDNQLIIDCFGEETYNYKEVDNEEELDEDHFENEEWFVSDKYLYFNQKKFIAQN